VQAVDPQQRQVPALCYLAPDMAPGPATAEHVQNLLEPAEALGFPAWYLARIRSFLPQEA